MKLQRGHIAVAIALGLCTPWHLAAAPADCRHLVQEFALLAHMDMKAEGVAAYQELLAHKECVAALQSSPADVLPAPSDVPPVLALGRKLHTQARDASARQAGKALSDGHIPQASAEALRGLGPENAVRALGGMAMDVLAAGLESRQRLPQAQSVRKVGDAIRGEEQRWTGAAGTGTGTAPRQPEIVLDAGAVNAASCSGTYGFLSPLMRPYTAPSLADARQAVLNQSMPELLTGARRQTGTKAQALTLLNEQMKEYNRAADEAAQTANHTDGSGNSASISRVASDTLELGYPCGPSAAVHAAAVCAYIAFRWGSLGTRTSIAMVERCWDD